MKPTAGEYSRRRILGASGITLLGGLAGCLSGTGSPPDTGSDAPAGPATDGPNADPTATYTHGTYGYSFRLPSTWTVEEDVIEDGVSLSSVVSIPGEVGEVGRIYVNDVPDAHPRNDVVEALVDLSADHWDTIETGEMVIADGQRLPVATASSADYLQIRWLSVLAGSTRFDVVPVVWTDALSPGLSARIDATLRSFSPPEGPPDAERVAGRRPVATAATSSHAPVDTLRANPWGEPLRPLAVRSAPTPATLAACEVHEARLREINARAATLEREQATLRRGTDSAIQGLANRIGAKSDEGLPGLVGAFELIVILCNLVDAFMAGSNALRAVQVTTSEQRAEAAAELRQCRVENPDSAPGRPGASITAVTRQSITLELENVPMERFTLRFITDSGDGVERLEHAGPIEAPGGRFSGTVEFADHGFSAENKRVRMVIVLIPVEGSGSDRPVTALTSLLDPYGDYAA